MVSQATEQAQGITDHLICELCNQTFEPHALSEHKCPPCFFSFIEELYFEHIHPLIEHGVYSENRRLTRNQAIKGLAIKIAANEFTRYTIEDFNEYDRELTAWEENAEDQVDQITFEEAVSQARRQEISDRSTKDQPVSKLSTIDDFVRTMHIARMQRELWSSYLLERFRYDPVARVWLPDSPSRLKVTDHLRWKMAVTLYDSYNADFITGATCALVHIGRGNNLEANIAEVLSVMRQWRAEEPYMTSISRLDCDSSTDREIALAHLTGWVRARWKSFPNWEKVSNRLSNSEFASIVYLSLQELRPTGTEPVDIEALGKDLTRKVSAALKDEELVEEHHQRITYQQNLCLSPMSRPKSEKNKVDISHRPKCTSAGVLYPKL